MNKVTFELVIDDKQTKVLRKAKIVLSKSAENN